MIIVDVKTDKLVQGLTRLERKQLPFATALMLTRLAQLSQKEVRAALPAHFKLRNTFVSRGIQFTKAKKSTIANMEAEIGASKKVGKTGRGLDFMERQEEGGRKSPIAGGRHIAVPASTRGTKSFKVGTNSNGIIRRGQRPRALLAKPKLYFIAEHKGVLGIWKRTGKKKTKSGYPKPHINLMYTLVPNANVKPIWAFEKTVKGAVQSNVNAFFKSALDQAMKTAR